MKQTLERTSLKFAALAMLTAAALAGCQSNQKPAEEAEGPTEEEIARQLDAELVTDVRQAMHEQGIVTQGTLYPHHFITGSATLNSLGEHDLAVLADHYRNTPATEGVQWTLNVRRGDASDALYTARVNAVTAGLSRGGVDADSVRVADGTAGGAGMPSERVRTVLEKEAKAKPYYEDDNGGGVGDIIENSNSSSSSEAK